MPDAVWFASSDASTSITKSSCPVKVMLVLNEVFSPLAKLLMFHAVSVAVTFSGSKTLTFILLAFKLPTLDTVKFNRALLLIPEDTGGSNVIKLLSTDNIAGIVTM